MPKSDARSRKEVRGTPEDHDSLLPDAIRKLLGAFPLAYWQRVDEAQQYPEEFVNALTRDGWLSVLIPEEFGGAGWGMKDAAIILEEINRAGGTATACHAQMYTMGAILRHGSDEQKRRWLPPIADGRLRLQAFAITEPDAGSNTLDIKTVARKTEAGYELHGSKIFISRVQHSDLMLVLARTTPKEQATRKTFGLSLFLLDLREQGDKVRVRPIRTMVNHETNEVFFEGAAIPADNIIGEEGEGFRYVLSGMNAERILVASEAIGDARYFIERAVQYASSRTVFGRKIGENQGVQFPIADAAIAVEAAACIRDRAASQFDSGQTAGPDANMAKYLASRAAWQAANVAMDTFGGYGLSVEYHLERKFREARLPLVAPVANNLVLSYVAQHVLGMPRSF